MKRWAPVLGTAAATALVAVVASAQVAQVGTLRGSVIDAQGNPIAGATVSVKAAEGRALTFKSKTKKDGTFLQLTAQTSGPWTISIAKDGFQTWVSPKPVRVKLGGEVAMDPVTLFAGDGSPATEAAAAAAAEAEKARQEQERRELEAVAGKVDQATALLEAGEAARQAGDATLAAQKLDEAEQAYRALIESNPTLARLYFNLGLVLEKKRQWDDAAAQYLKAAELKPDMAEAYAGAAAMRLSAGQPAKAAELLEQALKNQPDDPRMEYLLGLARFNEGSYAEASPVLEKAARADPTNAEPYYYLGVIAVAEDRTADARKALEKYIAMRPANERNLQVARDMLQSLK